MNDQAAIGQAEDEVLTPAVSDEELEAAANAEKHAPARSAYDYTCVFNPAPGC